MKHLLYSTEKFIVPDKFKKHISKKNTLFKINKAADATDLYRTLIDSFINEIKKESKYQSFEMDTSNTPGGEISINKNALYEEIKNEMKNIYIYSILNVYNIVTYECPNHNENNLTYSIESDSNITFYLEKIMKNRQKSKSPITIKECFEYVQKEKTNNGFFCNNCQKIVTGKSNEKIFYPPNILTIILNRGHGKTFKGNVQIDTILNISDYIDKDGKRLNNYNDKEEYYRLIGSCNHHGESSPTGHYTATCYNEEKSSYYLYSDTSVRHIKYYQYYGEPYILFYKRIKMSDNDDLSEIQDTIDTNKIEKDSILNKDKYENTLEKVFYYLYYKKYKNYTVELNKNNIYEWKIKMKNNNISLIMNFNDPPNYNLSTITCIENTNKSVNEFMENFDFNNKISLKEKVIDIFEKIHMFLVYFYNHNTYNDNIVNTQKKICKNCSCIII